MYLELIIAILLGITGGAGNILYEKYFTKGNFKITKSLLTKRIGTAVAAAALVFYGLAEPATASFDIVNLVESFSLYKLADFFAYGIPFIASGYFADDVIDVAIDKVKSKINKKLHGDQI